ncbi:putative G-protein coupled receptor 156 [Gasterosteus aculeatus]
MRVDGLASVMEPELNCSSQCDSPLCFIHSGVNRQDGLHILQRLCTLSSTELPRRPVSPVLSAVVWTLLSCGILLAFCFLLFTLRFKNNRIVKMSSPNLNVLTLFGSVLTYSSGFFFAVGERSQGGASTAVLQARMWTLCVGSTLMFGPILGKTWRLYRVFTQRVPDKRVIIRDIQLMGLVALLVLVDMLVLTTWNLTDPIRCSRTVRAVVTVVERDISYSLSQLDTCSSVYSALWIVIIALQKVGLLFYGTYLAGLTSNVSHPPVNQSPTIMTTVTLVTLFSAVAVPVSIFLQAWPDLVYITVAGAIFICTLATNCMLFVPQLTQWRQFEEDQNNPSQMAKYFSSPSKSQPSVYSQDEMYYILGENDSMKKILSEKDAVIDSLQEQVNNAKGKLLRLVSASQPPEDQHLDSADSNLNSTSTQTTELQADGSASSSSSSLPQRDAKSQLSPPHLYSRLTAAAVAPSAGPPSAPGASAPAAAPSLLPGDVYESENMRGVSAAGLPREDLKPPSPLASPGSLRTAAETVHFVTSLQSRRGLNPSPLEAFNRQSGALSQLAPNARPAGFVSSEQLQEILQELSVDAVMEFALRSPGQTSATLKRTDASALSPLSLRTPHSPHPPAFFRYPSISPYAMRKRRPPFHPSRKGLGPPRFYAGSEAAGCEKIRDNWEHEDAGKHRGGIPVDGPLLQVHNPDLQLEEEEEEEKEEGNEAIRKGQKRISRSRRLSALHRADPTTPPDVEAGGGYEQRRRRIRDSCGYWDSDSSSSTDHGFYHRPYCDSCLQRGSLMSSESSSDSSDSEYGGYTSLCRSPLPVVFKEDIKPTFV